MKTLFLGTVLLKVLASAASQVWSGEVTPELLMLLAGFMISFAADLIPGFNTWYDGFSKEQKGGVMLVMMVLLGIAAVAVDCAGWLNFGMCSNGFAGGLQYIVAMVVGNQITHYMNLSKLLQPDRAVANDEEK